MQKIKALLGKSGCKTELVDSICEALENYKTTLKERLEAESAARVEAIKKACIEETATHKRELARRLTIFCETKASSIESQLKKQFAINESEATARLQSVRSLLDGVTTGPNGDSSGQVTAVDKKRISELSEARDRAVETANRQTQVATKVLSQVKALQRENTQLKAKNRQLTESRTTRQQPQRRQGQPVTTRPTIVENQLRTTGKPTPATAPPKSDTVAGIAAQIAED